MKTVALMALMACVYSVEQVRWVCDTPYGRSAYANIQSGGDGGAGGDGGGGGGAAGGGDAGGDGPGCV